jgi:hypothetical protein
VHSQFNGLAITLAQDSDTFGITALAKSVKIASSLANGHTPTVIFKSDSAISASILPP